MTSRSHKARVAQLEAERERVRQTIQPGASAKDDDAVALAQWAVERIGELTERADAAVARCDALRKALKRIRDHGETHDEPCWALHLHRGDCADAMQKIARQALSSFSNG